MDVLSQMCGSGGAGRISQSSSHGPSGQAPPPRDDQSDQAPEPKVRGPASRSLPWANAIHWREWGNALARGDLTPLPDPVAAEVRRLAESPSFVDIAVRIGFTPVLLVIAALATLSTQVAGGRVARRIVKGLDARHLSRAVDLLILASKP